MKATWTDMVQLGYITFVFCIYEVQIGIGHFLLQEYFFCGI